jgi:hypothetical protein
MTYDDVLRERDAARQALRELADAAEAESIEHGMGMGGYLYARIHDARALDRSRTGEAGARESRPVTSAQRDGAPSLSGSAFTEVGTIIGCGGGMLEVLVPREMTQYPEPGTQVFIEEQP